VRITIDVEPGARPISGRLRRENGGSVEFQGMIELISLIDRVAELESGEPVPSGDDPFASP
jgi:hypothetical protein